MCVDVETFHYMSDKAQRSDEKFIDLSCFNLQADKLN